MKTPNRGFFITFPFLTTVAVSRLLATTPATPAPVQLHWLEQAPAVAGGVSWGVPWPQGVVQPHDALVLRTTEGHTVPMQTWPLACWPDGSVKWSGHAIAAEAGLAGPFQIVPGAVPEAKVKIACAQDEAAVRIDTGALRCVISRQGSNLFESLSVGGRQVARDAKLVAWREDRTEFASAGALRQQLFVSRVKAVTLEQAGPIRAVVKIEGVHAAAQGDRAWLPFVVRFYFFAGSAEMRIVHSFVFDGAPESDFIKGLGLSVTVPFQEEPQNRHVRFVGDGGGVWAQPVLLLPGYRPQVGAQVVDEYAAHLAGQRTPDLSAYDERTRAAIRTVPVWNDFKLEQLAPDSFSIAKRTTDKSSWLQVANGRRAPGYAVLGDVSGGIAVGLRSFWEKYPTAIEISHAAAAVGELTLWFWSPEAPAMDLRTYDTTGHDLNVNYEDWKAGWGTAVGIANTHDLTLRALTALPSNGQVAQMAQAAAAPALLVCAPEYYHAIPAFGYWSLPDRSTPVRRWIEDQVDQLARFYAQQVEERHWYGFWDFGDVMHNYDYGRHEWRYDIGGWAWTNGELMPNVFLWFSFLRTGRADLFRMAEAMDRHTSEVDVHHLGRFAPLGSRHNVNHWGDGAKQPRISQSTLKRFYYYLTTDDRVGDLMREQLTADAVYPEIKKQDPTQWGSGGPGGWRHATFGTDWTSYVSNWMTEWERTGDTKWRDKILAGMKSMVAIAPPGELRVGVYDPQTGVFSADEGNEAAGGTAGRPPASAPAGTGRGGRGGPAGGGRGAVTYFDLIFGGPEVLAQLQPLIDYPEFWTGWANTCERLGASMRGEQMSGPRASAYAAYTRHDATLGQRAWDQLIGRAVIGPDTRIAQPVVVETPAVLNPVHDPAFLGGPAGWQLHGPASIQWALNAIETLELAKDYLPAWEAARAAGQARPATDAKPTSP